MAGRQRGKSGAERRRVIIEGVVPEIDCGRFPIKRTVDERVVVEANIFTDGHDAISGVLMYRHEKERRWREVPLEERVNDRWRASFATDRLGRYHYSVAAWVDPFKSWRRDMVKRIDAGQDIAIDLKIGAALVAEAAGRAAGADRRQLTSLADRLGADDIGRSTGAALALDDELSALVGRHPDRGHATEYPKTLEVLVEPVRARFSSWYELFPRSAGAPGTHGTLRDVIARLDYVEELGFDVLYLPPIHPIGRVRRKGPNNAEVGAPDDVGSPWGIGAAEGGHKDIHPDLGTFDDFHALVEAARSRDIDVALDIAFQVAPDHPYVEKHPSWFRQRPDGTIQYAENPPKKYQDIYPFDFDTPDWKALWKELESVFEFWIGHGVRVFRVDNPHTKSFRFWEWAIDRIKRRHPEVIFLSEAFTRPNPMYRLAKLGFTQSYTYFAWRYGKRDFTTYMTELTRPPVSEFYRPNFWPNTPDILTEQLQTGGRPTFMARFVLAATLTASYGIYGPAFELMEHTPARPGSEEYMNSEKYEIRSWDLDRPDSLRHFIRRVNQIRRANPALHANQSLRFHTIENDQLLVYSKHTTRPLTAAERARYTANSASLEGAALAAKHGALPGGDDAPAAMPDNLVLVAVNLDPRGTQAGWVQLPLAEWGIDPHVPFQVHDLLGDARYTWRGEWNYIELNPLIVPAHVFHISLPG